MTATRTSSSSRPARVRPHPPRLPPPHLLLGREKLADSVPAATVWNCIATACKDVLRDSKVDPAAVKGIGFDATCSLVVEDIKARKPVCVTPGSYDKPAQQQDGFVQDVILWADHRAHKEAKQINATKRCVVSSL